MSNAPIDAAALYPRLQLKKLLQSPKWRPKGATIHEADRSILLVPFKHGKGGLVGVRDAKIWGYESTIVNLDLDACDLYDCLRAITAHVPASELESYCIRSAKLADAHYIMEQLMLGRAEPFEVADHQWINPTEYKDGITPADWARPNTYGIIGAHGGSGFQCVHKGLWKMFLRYNERYAVIDADGDVLVRDAQTQSVYTAEAFFKHAKSKIEINEKDAQGNIVTKTVDCGKQWFNSPYRTTYKGKALFPLGKNTRGEEYQLDPKTRLNWNTWQGFGVKPKKGDCRKFKEHLLFVVCHGNRWHYRYLWRWLAHCVQRPWEKPRVAIVLWSEEKQSAPVKPARSRW
jgi:hypothetical protein